MYIWTYTCIFRNLNPRRLEEIDENGKTAWVTRRDLFMPVLVWLGLSRIRVIIGVVLS